MVAVELWCGDKCVSVRFQTRPARGRPCLGFLLQARPFLCVILEERSEARQGDNPHAKADQKRFRLHAKIPVFVIGRSKVKL